MSGVSNFEQVRDNFFVDPCTPHDHHLIAATTAAYSSLINGIPVEQLMPPELRDSPLGSILQEMTTDYMKARKFDHLSVAQLHPSGSVIGILAHNLSTLVNNNTIVEEVSPLETPYERVALQWMNQHIAGYDPEKSSGILTSGGTSANQTAMLIARVATQRGRFGHPWDGKQPVTIIANEMAHYSIKKAAQVLFPRGQVDVEPVPLRADTLKMDTDRLDAIVKRHDESGRRILAIVGVAGETETGLVEDLDKIADIAKSRGIFFHADGAYGAPFVLSQAKDLFKGIGEADTITCDPHKYLYTPYSVGSLLIKNFELHGLLDQFNEDGNEYMFNKEGHNLGSARIEGSMGGQGAASVYWTIKVLGEKGLGALLDHNLEVTKTFAEAIERGGTFRNIFEPELNTACIVPTEYNNDTALFAQVEKILAEENIYLSRTNLPLIDPTTALLSNRDVFRFVATHPYTSNTDAEAIAKTLADAWKFVTKES